MTIMGAFNRPVGPAPDVRELEYVSALHQTDLPRLRRDGTITAVDIKTYLRSRWGLNVELDQALDIIVALGGGGDDEAVKEKDGDDDGRYASAIAARDEDIREEKARDKTSAGRSGDEAEQEINPTLASREEMKHDDGGGTEAAASDDACLDIVQLLSIILMPTLARSGKEWVDINIHGIDPGDMPVDEVKTTKWWTLGYFKERRQFRKRTKEVQRIQSLRPMPENVLGDVLKFMLASLEDEDEDERKSGGCHDSVNSVGDRKHPVLNERLVRRLLEAHCEYERAADTELIDEMVRMAVGGDRGDGAEPILDEGSFVRALTADMELWTVGNEDRLSSIFRDVFGFETQKEFEELLRILEDEDESGEPAAGQSMKTSSQPDLKSSNLFRNNEGNLLDMASIQKRLNRKPTASHIDFVTDTHRSTSFTVALWIFFLATALCYMSLFQALAVTQGCRGPDFGCTLAETVVAWLTIALFLSAAGLVIIAPISLANNAIFRSNKVTVGCFILTAIYAAIPFAFVYNWMQNIEPPYENAEPYASSWYYEGAMWLTLATGIFLSVVLVLQLPLNTLAGMKLRRKGKITKWMVASNITKGMEAKMAGTRKVNTLLLNAHALHPMGDQKNAMKGRTQSQSERAMSNFVLYGEREVECGGFSWTWRRLLSRSLLDTEGVWLHSRLYVGQAAQLFVALFFGLLFFFGTPMLAEEVGEARESLIEEFPPPMLPQWIYDIMPTEQQVKYAFYPASSIAMLVALILILLYIPSSVSTILKFRCGRIPSLHDSTFVKYRMAPDTIYLNVANMLYAMVGAVSLFFVVFALLIFVCTWPFSRQFIKLIFAWVLGLIITIVLKVVAVKICRAKSWRALYRTRPAVANFASLVLECWYIGLGGGVMVGRVTQFILAMLFWIGRVDVPYLSEDVSIAGYGFDLVPTSFRKDLLVHDAHRHPFIERLSMMYMMRLAHGEKFSSRAGACWRNLFVVTLFPWMKKNRVFKSRLVDGGDAVTQSRDKLLIEDEGRTLGERVVDGALKKGSGLKDGVVAAATDTVEVVNEWPKRSKVDV